MAFDEHADRSAHREPVSPEEPPVGMRPGPDVMGRRRFLTSATVVLSALVAGVHATAADARGPEFDAPQPAASSPGAIPEELLWRNQDRLSDLRDWTETLPGVENSGYVTLINEAATRRPSTILVWHGPPDTVQRQIMAEAPRRHISISIQHREYSMDDLERAADQLLSIDSGTGVFRNFTVSSVGTIDIYFDGVTVLGEYIHPPAEGIPAADTALARALAARTGVAVRIEQGRIVW